MIAGSCPVGGIDVDAHGHLVFGGTGSYTGWKRGGGPRIVAGLGGADHAMQSEDGRWVQLGHSGVEVNGNWTLDCRVRVDASTDTTGNT